MLATVDFPVSDVLLTMMSFTPAIWLWLLIRVMPHGAAAAPPER